jgi:hypothetical protein
MKVIQLHVWLKDPKNKWYEPEVVNKNGDPVPGKRIVIEPSGPSVVQMKLDVAKVILEWRNKIESYYVVAVVERDDGTPGYRTIVPMTFIK